MLGMFDAGDVQGIEHAIMLAIGPAFLLTSLFAALNVLTQRLGRLIDRERDIRDGGAEALPGERLALARRAHWLNLAIGLCVLAAILMCLVIVASFVGLVLELLAAFVIAGLLLVAMVALIAALLCFFAEVRLAARHLPLGQNG